jgi:UDP-N-acetyl-D-mannosaminuronate dehydrogenase
MAIVVVGLGEVGGALYELMKDAYGDAVHGVEIDKPYDGECDYLHICIPYSDRFVEIVNDYIGKYSPKITFNHSSVPVGTTEKLTQPAVHTPVRGKHPHLKQCLKDYVKYVGIDDEKLTSEVVHHLGAVFNIKPVEGSRATEFMKIASLSKYLVYLSVADEIDKACDVYGIDYKWIQHWERTQNDEIDKSYADMKWPVLSAPKGRIGGHCVLPISRLFVEDKSVSSDMVSTAFKKYKDI